MSHTRSHPGSAASSAGPLNSRRAESRQNPHTASPASRCSRRIATERSARANSMLNRRACGLARSVCGTSSPHRLSESYTSSHS